MRHALLTALALAGTILTGMTLSGLGASAHAANLTLSFGGSGQTQRYQCTLKDGRTHVVQAPTRGRAYRACRAWAAGLAGELATVLPVAEGASQNKRTTVMMSAQMLGFAGGAGGAPFTSKSRAGGPRKR